MSSERPPQPLGGIKILDFTTLLPGPMAGLMLSEAGASVLKVERPGSGEEMRGYVPKWGRESVDFAMLNAGKKSLAIDLKDRRQLELLIPLIREADVLLEQFRPGVMERLGLGYQAVSAINSSIIYCSITGYGQFGPKSDVAGHDLNYIADTGLLSLSLGNADRPTLPPVLAADLAGGSYPAVVNVLLALINRQQTGQGCYLDIAMTDNLFMLMTWAIGRGICEDDWPKSSASKLTGGSPRYQIYPTADGRHVAAAPLEQKFWDNFCKLIELPAELRDDSKDPAATIEKVREIVASKPAGEWKDLFADVDCCCSIVQELAEAMRETHFHIRGNFDHSLENEEGDTLPAVAVSIAPQFRGDPNVTKSAPPVGAHNDSIIKKLK